MRLSWSFLVTDEPYNAGERSHVKAAAKAVRQAERARGDIVRTIMGTVGGRAWMLDKLERCHVFSSSFNTEGLRMAFAEGERNIGLQLLSEIMSNAAPSYTLMMSEKNERDLTASARRQPDREPDGTAPDREPNTPERAGDE